ncbi:MAG TPA: putative metal-dependent hydrolase [Terriglobales bacterium]|jgi:hypothetical protein|nr:putative metal-dependent hydrolase [Terriglobales bacterium]
MAQAQATDPRYPIGKFEAPASISEPQRQEWIAAIVEAPQRLRVAVKGLSEPQINTAYREGGWTVRQVVHHVPESHMNAYIRFKLALTEDNPTIKPYEEDRWALLPDISTPTEVSLQLLESLHVRWVNLLKSLKEQEWKRTYFHPAMNKTWPLEQVLALYAWHGRHHVAHITSLRQSKGWN